MRHYLDFSLKLIHLCLLVPFSSRYSLISMGSFLSPAIVELYLEIFSSTLKCSLRAGAQRSLFTQSNATVKGPTSIFDSIFNDMYILFTLLPSHFHLKECLKWKFTVLSELPFSGNNKRAEQLNKIIHEQLCLTGAHFIGDSCISAQWVVNVLIVVQRKWFLCPKSAFLYRIPRLHQLCRDLAMTRI